VAQNQFAKGTAYLRQHGAGEFGTHLREKAADQLFDYGKWIKAQEISSVRAGYERAVRLPFMPVIHAVVLGADRESGADRTRQSVLSSTYRQVHLTAGWLPAQAADTDYAAFLFAGDTVTRNAFYEAAAAAQDGAGLIYTDSDCMDETGALRDPRFKCDYSEDYLRSYQYIGALALVQVGVLRAAVRRTGSGAADLRALADPVNYWDMLLAVTRRTGKVRHISKVLCHALVRGESGREAWALPEARGDEMRRILQEDLALRGLHGSVREAGVGGVFYTDCEPEEGAMVSVIIPNRDNIPMLRKCLRSIRQRAGWGNYEILIVENNSVNPSTARFYEKADGTDGIRVLRFEGPFNFSAINNFAAKQARGKYLLLMNNDVIAHTQGWMRRLLGQVSRPGIAAAGPKLCYPDGTVQSAGITVGMGGFAGSMMVAEDGDDPGYMMRAAAQQDMSAVTAALMMVRRESFEKAGGLDPELAVALNDVDFCLRLRQQDGGRERILFDPSVIAIHYESRSRGAEDTPAKKRRFAREKKYFCRRWAAFLKAGDPAYNPNLSLRRCDYSQKRGRGL